MRIHFPFSSLLTATILVLANVVHVARVNAAPIAELLIGRETTISTAQLHENAVAAQILNNLFKDLEFGVKCEAGTFSCIEGQVALCSESTSEWTPHLQCAGADGTSCFAVPLTDPDASSVSTRNIQCLPRHTALSLFEQAGVPGGIAGDDSETSSSATQDGSSVFTSATVTATTEVETSSCDTTTSDSTSTSTDDASATTDPASTTSSVSSTLAETTTSSDDTESSTSVENAAAEVTPAAPGIGGGHYES